MDNIEERFDRLEQHMTQLIGMVGKLAKDTDERFSRLEKRLDNVEKRLDSIEGRLDNVEKRLDSIEVRLDIVENKLDAFQTVTLERFDKLDSKMDFLTNKWIETDLEVFRLKKQQLK